MRPLYVYVDYRVDDGRPFYVGKGYENRTRDFRNRNYAWKGIVEKHGVRRELIMGSFDNDFICEEEMRLIRELRTRVENGGANFTDGGEGSVGWHPSDETRAKITRSLTGKMAGEKHPLFGIGHTNAAKQKMSQTRAGMPQPWKRKAVEQLNEMGEVVAQYSSVREAKQATGLSEIIKCCKGYKESTRGTRWRYANS